MCVPKEKPSIRRSFSESLVGVIAQGLIRTNDDKPAAYQDILMNIDAFGDYIQRGSPDEMKEIMSQQMLRRHGYSQ